MLFFGWWGCLQHGVGAGLKVAVTEPAVRAGDAGLASLPLRDAPLGAETWCAPAGRLAPEPSTAARSPPRAAHWVAALQDLADLHRAGALSDSEFACAKKKLLEA